MCVHANGRKNTVKMAFKGNDKGKNIQDTACINASAADDENSKPDPDEKKIETSASTCDNGNSDDEDQTYCKSLNTELVKKQENEESDKDDWITISKPNQGEEGSGTECQGRTSSMADIQDTERPAINLGISNKSATDTLAPGTCRSAEDEIESNTVEACNICRNVTAVHSVEKQENAYCQERVGDTTSSTIDSTNNSRTDMNEW